MKTNIKIYNNLIWQEMTCLVRHLVNGVKRIMTKPFNKVNKDMSLLNPRFIKIYGTLILSMLLQFNILYAQNDDCCCEDKGKGTQEGCPGMQIEPKDVICEVQPNGSIQLIFLDNQAPYLIETASGLSTTIQGNTITLQVAPQQDVIYVTNKIKCKFIKPMDEQPGCTDPCAPNYNPLATTDDGSCEPFECNADCLAGPFGGTWDSITCTCVNETIPIYGCTDAAAFNYNPEANCDDDSCNYEGCCICCGLDGDLIFNNSNSEATCLANPGFIWVPMSCEQALSTYTCLPVKYGCTNPCSYNYNPAATHDDGSCVILPTICNMEICLGDITQWNSTTCDCEIVVPQVLGCMNQIALNYNPDANCDDDSCIIPPEGCCICCEDGGITYNGSNNQTDCEAQPGFTWVELDCMEMPQNYFCQGSGCRDTNACNYNPAATSDNGTCDYSCQCFPSLQLSGNIPSSACQSSTIIQSTAIIDSGKTVELFAPDCIHLEIGTSIKAGSTFKAAIEDCSE